MSKKEMSTGATIALAQKMIRQGDDFEASLGSALLHGSYKNRRKIIVNFGSVIDKFKTY